MYKKIKNKLNHFWMSNFSKTTVNERIIKTYNKGKKRYHTNCIVIITISDIVLFYLGLQLMEINILKIKGVQYFYIILFLLWLLFINKNIFIPVIGDWKQIENKYNEVINDSDN